MAGVSSACVTGGGLADSGHPGVDASGLADGGTDYGGDGNTVPWPTRDGSTCESLDVAASAEAPNVLIVLDRSTSMYLPDQGIDRWTPAVAAITTVTAALDDAFRFGLMLFPGSDNACAAGLVSASPEPHRAALIASQLGGAPATLVGGGTPLAITIAEAGRVLMALDGDSYVLVVTDGAPNCDADENGASCPCVSGGACTTTPLNCLDRDDSVAAVQGLATAGIGTFVIGYDTRDWAGVLDELAAAGGTGRDRYLPVADGDTLEAALREVAGTLVPCEYALDHLPEDYHYVRVQVDDGDIRHVSEDPGSGWQLTERGTVELTGAACRALQDGRRHEISIVRECEPVVLF